MDSINVADICQGFTSHADSKGIDPTPGASLNIQGDLSVYSLSISAEQIMSIAAKFARDIAIKEFFVSLDCNNSPDRAQEFPSILVIFHVCKGKGEKSRIGVMEYGWDQEKSVATYCPVQWDNEFWIQRYSTKLAALVQASNEIAAVGNSALLN